MADLSQSVHLYVILFPTDSDMEFTLNIASHSSYKEAPILPGGRNVLLHAQDF